MHLRALLIFLAPSLASLPFSTALQAQARCVDSLAGASWRSTPLTAMIGSPGPGERNVDRYVESFLPTLAQSYRDPNGGMIREGAMITVPPLDARPAIRGNVTITFDRDGRVLATQLVNGTGIAKLDSAIVHAVRSAGNGRGFGKVPRKFRGDTLSVTIAISDRVPAAPRTGPLGSYSTSYLVANVPPRIRSMPPARAPRGRRGREVVLAGTVNARGRMMPATIRLVSTNDSTLIPIARRSMERAVYHPGTYHGCPAEATIRFPFKFP